VPGDRVFGPNASIIMAAFGDLNPDGSRFADDTFGAFYAAASLDAVAIIMSFEPFPGSLSEALESGPFPRSPST
jgi:hypothetical protein